MSIFLDGMSSVLPHEWGTEIPHSWGKKLLSEPVYYALPHSQNASLSRTRVKIEISPDWQVIIQRI